MAVGLRVQGFKSLCFRVGGLGYYPKASRFKVCGLGFRV